MQKLLDIIKLIDEWIKDYPENSLTSGWIIKDWYNKEVDRIRGVISNSQDWLSSYQNELISKTWISTLKIKYTNVSWYFIEISKSQISKIPNDFIYIQTLVNASRFSTPELKNFEKDLMNSSSILSSLEYNLFSEIREKILNSFDDLREVSNNISNIDFITSLSKVAYKNNYSKPTISKKLDLQINSWRHPVIEQIEKDFISNDLNFSGENNFIHIITWPNMWWKSTFLRQNALIILMAHIWSFVPAKDSIIPLTDKIFSRVWASDNLFLWQSTFMVEMQEVANIINNSTKNSFVIIDEIWRWTSTYDWMSLAWGILKFNHDNIKAKTLFATHYHELVDESKKLKWVKNFSVAVWENDDNIIFLRKVVPWWIKKSYWIEVAKLSWINNEIISEARKMLLELEKIHNNSYKQLSLWITLENSNSNLSSQDKKLLEKIKKELVNLDINNLTPIQSFNKIIELKEISNSSIS